MSKLYNTEIASVIKEKNIIDLAEKMRVGKSLLTSEDTEAIELLDNFAREIGKSGKNPENNTILAEYIKETIEPEVFNPDESILNNMFDMGTIGEFDEKVFTGLPKNTIKVYDATRGGN